MKTITTIAMMLSLIVMCQSAFAQNCPGNKVLMAQGWRGSGCGPCKQKCVTPAEVSTYQANGWYLGKCFNCNFFDNWVRVEEENNGTESSIDGMYPNPTSGNITIAFNVLEQTDVTIHIQDITGRQVATLVDGVLDDGSSEVTWDAGNVAPGVYFVVMEAGDYSETKKLSVID